MGLRHLHLPYRAPFLYPPYSLASRVQEHARRQLLDFKDAIVLRGRPPSPPTLISFTPLPTYTLGRRQTAPLSEDEVARLQAPLHVASSPKLLTAAAAATTTSTPCLPVSIVSSPRGGLTTYHGPGQVVLWPVLDLRSLHHKQFTVRCYSRLLEDTTIATLGSLFGLAAFTTADPGVWVRPEPAKIAALGVHLRRHVSALGTAINVATPGSDVTSEKLNPWARIIACGLEGKAVTSVAAELAAATTTPDAERDPLPQEAVTATAWAEELARRIEVDGVDVVGQPEVMDLLADLIRHDASVEEQQFVTEMRRVLGV
ncbi:hypothetical protein B0T26DRAFT_631152 [Lasiosphaeria miniovina]|uniref:lipoyl(octanoyl) transferase n=1 Tax=Lasiosphaeria miniovina TaxID=1954250 RepID=A0AA40ECY6_9PEZI|nr:uncharacterized protein B0T26DRAFT_631152 [Lasiosphaeria miniovina]KAK0733747.1 hypothetical protein B0T26DRAFT_631152 [Lasiosphaeria miniovina]